MEVGVVVKIDAPGERTGRELPVFLIGRRAGISDGVARAVGAAAAGAVMFPVGVPSEMTVNVALLLVAVPIAFVTTARNDAPLSDRAADGNV